MKIDKKIAKNLLNLVKFSQNWIKSAKNCTKITKDVEKEA